MSFSLFSLLSESDGQLGATADVPQLAKVERAELGGVFDGEVGQSARGYIAQCGIEVLIYWELKSIGHSEKYCRVGHV